MHLNGSSFVPALGEFKSGTQIKQGSNYLIEPCLRKVERISLGFIDKQLMFQKPSCVIDLNALCFLTDVEAERRQWLFVFTQTDFAAW